MEQEDRLTRPTLGATVAVPYPALFRCNWRFQGCAPERRRQALEERRTERAEQALNEAQTRRPEAGWEADSWRYMDGREGQAAGARQSSEDERGVVPLPASDRLRTVAEARTELMLPEQAEQPPPIALRAATTIIVLPVLFIADMTALVLTILVRAAMASDPDPLTKLGLAVAELALAAADVYIAFQHVNYAHWLVTGTPIRSSEDLSNWTWQP
ncbi:MAG: hypothetical protein AB1543_06220 [Candidatus Bipolaricaulota bacterium]